MEVEVKLRLPDSTSHQLLSTILSRHHRTTHFQKNVFFDGTNAELSSNLAVLRLRFYNLDSHSILSIKAKPVLLCFVSFYEKNFEIWLFLKFNFCSEIPRLSVLFAIFGGEGCHGWWCNLLVDAGG
ncbi:unnamed protein product [Fraxinus pennsylvanica]|uniref:CYTH domain-containing protein n=1 Tax=Fraxinus pennsylvanica TaxID=56036 RepID=A0AAD2ECT4_9LAMI|nr:unnamed protein product [Fraxinus pennsylvanica]